jgi:hypothetical protein
MDKTNFYEEIVTVARHLYERSGKIEGRDLDHWLEAERIVNALWKIAGPDGEKFIQINVPVIKAEKWKK